MEAKYDFERKYREQILQCSRCGFCQAVCPVYGSTLRPALNALSSRGALTDLAEAQDTGPLEEGEAEDEDADLWLLPRRSPVPTSPYRRSGGAAPAIAALLQG